MVDYDEVDMNFRMKLPVLFQRLQGAALHHSESVGLGSAAMVAAGEVWILNRMRVDIYRMPVYREKITVRTWHKGSAGMSTWSRPAWRQRNTLPGSGFMAKQPSMLQDLSLTRDV